MIPNHVLNHLGPDDRVAILSRNGEIHFHVHASADSPDEVRAFAEHEGSQVLRTHMKDHQSILSAVEARESDVGGEG